MVPGNLLRPPDVVMRLARMGSAFQTRLSFMRSLTRRMAIENWEFSKPDIELDREGRGLDFFQRPDNWFSVGANDLGLRKCLETKVDICRCS